MASFSHTDPSAAQITAALHRANAVALGALALGRIVYGASEEALLALTGNHAENSTLALPCRELLAPHRGFWSDH